jgi:voltage-gated potassium channel
MLGVATQSPAVSSLIEDLLAYGKGLDLYERAVLPSEAGKPPVQGEELVVAVVRDGKIMTYADPGVAELRASDRLVLMHVQSPLE